MGLLVEYLCYNTIVSIHIYIQRIYIAHIQPTFDEILQNISFKFALKSISCCISNMNGVTAVITLLLLPRPKGFARYCFDPVCLSVCLSMYVCLCVRPIFWYFISRLLEEM